MKIYYLAHPVTADETYTTEQNLLHVRRVQKLLWEAGIRTVLPWSLHSKFLGNCEVVQCCDGIILVGHKLSEGMSYEKLAAESAGVPVYDMIGKKCLLAPERFISALCYMMEAA